MKPTEGQKIRFRGVTGTVLAFYHHKDYYYLNIAEKDRISSFTWLSEEDLEGIKETL